MPRGTEKVNEFKRYRQILAALYIGAISLGFLLLAASVVSELFFPNDLARCHRDVADLHDELGRVPPRLLALAGEDRSSEIMPRWQAFSEEWLKRWDQIAARCQLGEPTSVGTESSIHGGEARKRLARAHSELPAMRLEYQSLLVRFHSEQAADLARLKRDLALSRSLLKRADGGADEVTP